MGMTLTIRGSNHSNIADDFNRANGPLAGSKTSIGNRTWSKPTTGDTVASIVSQRLTCTAGASTDLYLIDADTGNYDLTIALAAVGSEDVKHSIVFRAIDEANHLALLFRQSGTIKGYQIAHRYNGTYTFLLSTTVIPKTGDVVSVAVDGLAAILYVNGTALGTAKLPGWADKTKVGIRMAGTDRDTIFDQFSLKTRA